MTLTPPSIHAPAPPLAAPTTQAPTPPVAETTVALTGVDTQPANPPRGTDNAVTAFLKGLFQRRDTAPTAQTGPSFMDRCKAMLSNLTRARSAPAPEPAQKVSADIQTHSKLSSFQIDGALTTAVDNGQTGLLKEVLKDAGTHMTLDKHGALRGAPAMVGNLRHPMTDARFEVIRGAARDLLATDTGANPAFTKFLTDLSNKSMADMAQDYVAEDTRTGFAASNAEKGGSYLRGNGVYAKLQTEVAGTSVKTLAQQVQADALRTYSGALNGLSGFLEGAVKVGEIGEGDMVSKAKKDSDVDMAAWTVMDIAGDMVNKLTDPTSPRYLPNHVAPGLRAMNQRTAQTIVDQGLSFEDTKTAIRKMVTDSVVLRGVSPGMYGAPETKKGTDIGDDPVQAQAVKTAETMTLKLMNQLGADEGYGMSKTMQAEYQTRYDTYCAPDPGTGQSRVDRMLVDVGMPTDAEIRAMIAARDGN